jgi:tRNA (cytidine56-2'-O)-methyltransferase
VGGALIAVLRLGHRPLRDKRVTTHVCLVARAFGADRVILTTPDDALLRTVRGVAKRFGGSFEVEVDARSHRRILEAWKGDIVHLTMYGEAYAQVAPKLCNALEEGRDLLLVVGAEKVPGDLYRLAHHNVAVGNQPHSEVAALAILLHALRPEALDAPRGGELRILPRARGKEVREERAARTGSER